MTIIDKIKLKKQLSKLNKKEYKIIKNLSYKSGNKIINIDYLIISKYGIFVLLIENNKVSIKGEIYDNEWININKKIKNPTKINYSHVISISNVLRMDSNIFIPIVCYPNKTKLEIEKPFNQVCNINDLIYIINKYDKPIYTLDIDKLYKYILSIDIKKEHKKSNSKELICPKCGHKLVLRKGAYGPFYGCTNYPKCKYTKKQH